MKIISTVRQDFSCYVFLFRFNFWARFLFYISHDFHARLLTYFTLSLLNGFKPIELRKTVNTVKVKRAKSKEMGQSYEARSLSRNELGYQRSSK